MQMNLSMHNYSKKKQSGSYFMKSEKTRRWCWNLPEKNLEIEVIGCEISNATQLLTIFVLSNTPHFAFTIVYKLHDTKEDIFV